MFTEDNEIVEKSFMLISIGGNKDQRGLDSWVVVSENDSDTGFAGLKMNTHAGTPQRYCIFSSGHHDQVRITIRQVTQLFWFPAACKSYVYIMLLSTKCNSITSENTVYLT